MLKINKLKKSYDKREILNIEDLNFPSKGFFVLRGENGRGKTTFLNIISGRDEKYSGTITLDNKNIKEIENYQNNLVCYITQHTLLLDEKTVLENFTSLKPGDINQIKDILTRVNLNDLLNNKVYTLSDGERKRLDIALKIYLDFQILLIDEVTSNLDEENAKKIISILKTISHEKLIIFSTHESDDFFDEEYIKTFTLDDDKIDFDFENESSNKKPFVSVSKTKHKLIYINFLKNSWVLQSFFSFLILCFSILLILGASFFSVDSETKYSHLANQYVKENFLINSYRNDEGMFFHNDKTDLIYDNNLNSIGISVSPSFNLKDEESIFNVFYTTFENKNLTFNLIEGRNPIKENEALIPSNYCDYFIKNNIFNSYGDFINKNLNSFFKVVGIYKSSDKVIGYSEELSEFYKTFEIEEGVFYPVHRDKFYTFMIESAFIYPNSTILNSENPMYFNFISDINDKELLGFKTYSFIQTPNNISINDEMNSKYKEMESIYNTFLISSPICLVIIFIFQLNHLYTSNKDYILFISNNIISKKNSKKMFIRYSLFYSIALLSFITILLSLLVPFIANLVVSKYYIGSSILTFFTYPYLWLCFVPLVLIMSIYLNYFRKIWKNN